MTKHSTQKQNYLILLTTLQVPYQLPFSRVILFSLFFTTMFMSTSSPVPNPVGVLCLFIVIDERKKPTYFIVLILFTLLRQFFKYTFAIFSEDFVICLFFLLIYILGSL